MKAPFSLYQATPGPNRHIPRICTLFCVRRASVAESTRRLSIHHLSSTTRHSCRGHYQEGIDVYKRLLIENRELLALHVYVAMCYYKLDYYDVSQEVLQAYLQHFQDSVTALNLKASSRLLHWALSSITASFLHHLPFCFTNNEWTRCSYVDTSQNTAIISKITIRIRCYAYTCI